MIQNETETTYYNLFYFLKNNFDINPKIYTLDFNKKIYQIYIKKSRVDILVMYIMSFSNILEGHGILNVFIIKLEFFLNGIIIIF